jgi:glycosyltransferase 2 family protein
MTTDRRLRALGWLISLAALAAVVVWALGQPAPPSPEMPGLVPVAVALYAVATLVRAERWRLLLLFNGASPSRLDCHALTCVGYMGNNVLPARAGDAMRVLYMAPRSDASARTVIGTLVAERVLDVSVLFSLYAVLAVALGAGTLSANHFAFAAALLAGALVLAVLAAVALHRRGHLVRAWAFVKPMLAATGNLRGRHGAEALGATLVVWAVEAGVWLCCADAAGLHVSALEALYLLALASLFVFVPAGPGNVGTLDAAVLFGARAIGRQSSAALSFLILLRLVLIVPITAVGLGFLVARYR